MALSRRHARLGMTKAVAALALAATLSCSHDEPTAVRGVNQRGVAPRSASLSPAASAGGFSTTLTFSDEYHPSGEKVLGSYPTSVVAQVTFTGTVDWYRVYPDLHQDFILTYDASGVCPGTSPAATAVGIYNDIGVHSPPLPCITGTSDRGPSPTQTNYGIFSGTLTAKWTQYYSCGSETDPCRRSVSTGVMVSVDPVQATLTLKASKYVSPPFQLVNFHADRVPTAGGQYGIPLIINQWVYTQDDGVVVNPGCPTGGSPTAWDCSYGPQKSGTMTVSATVNGVDQTQSVHIRVICQPTGDTLLDSLPILDALGAAWTQSSPTLDPTQRRERTWSVQCDANGVCSWTVYSVVGQTPCQSPAPSPDPGGARRAEGHTHPFIPYGSPGEEEIPSAACPRLPVGGTTFYGGTAYVLAGPSQPDLRNAAQSGGGFPRYVMDANYIYVMPPGTDPAAIAGATKQIPRVDSQGCRRI